MPQNRSSRPAAPRERSSARLPGDPRWRIGVIALLLLSLAGYLGWQEFASPHNDNQPDQWLGAFVRMGIIMGAVWLAWPELRKMSPWFLGLFMFLLPIIVIVSYRWKRLLPYFLVGGVVLYILRPKGNRRVS